MAAIHRLTETCFFGQVFMSEDLTRYILDLEGRVTALTGIVGSLMWLLRQHNILDPEVERRIYRSTSEAIVTDRPETEAAADRLILAMQSATNAARPTRPERSADA